MEKELFDETPSQPHASLLLDQCDANEHLVLAALRAQEEAEEAHSSRIVAEDESDHLRAKAAELVATGELRERLLGIIGHDLRNPLSAMVMAAQLLEQANLPPQPTWLAQRIVASGLRMERMIDQLADLTRSRLGGGFELELAPCNLAELCKDIVDELRLGSSVPIRLETSGALVGRWDADRVSAVLSNLIGNAIGHAAPGTPVQVAGREGEAGVVVEVRNQGLAIPAEQQEQIFSAFGRASSSAGRDSGHLGLGLYIGRQIALAHGGTLEVESSLAGTVFTLRLPRLPPA